jgi:hypothetical protein
MWPGDKLLAFLGCNSLGSGSNSGNLLGMQTPANVGSSLEPSFLTPEQRKGYDALIAYGVTARKAEQLARSVDLDEILDQIEYVDDISNSPARHKSRIWNPQGMLISFLQDNISVPKSFLTTRKRNAAEEASNTAMQLASVVARAKDTGKAAYEAWVSKQVDETLERRYPGPALSNLLQNVIATQNKRDRLFAQIPVRYKEEVALQHIRKEIIEELALPNCEDWCATHSQYDLFN